MNDWLLAWRFLWRDLRAGELGTLGLALVLAVAALTGVAFLADRLERALQLDAHRLLGGDLLLVADHPWPEQFEREARRRGLDVAHSAVFPSMTLGPAGTQLAEIKAVSPNFPLRGELRIALDATDSDWAVRHAPAAGEVWLESRLARSLAVKPGEPIGLGELRPKVGALLTHEPEQGFNAFTLAPRLMMNLVDLPASGLVQPGSRISWRLHLAGERQAVADFRAWAQARLSRGERLEDLDNARPELRTLLDRAMRFLRLAALLTVVLAAVAAMLATRRYLERHLDACALLRCLGARQGQLMRVVGGEFFLFGLLCLLMGSGLGLLAQAGLVAVLGKLLAEDLPTPSLWPLLQGSMVGLVLIVGFVLPPLMRLAGVPTLRVLHREWQDMPPTAAFLAWGFGAIGLIALLFWLAEDTRLATVVLLGFTLAVLLFAAAAWLLIGLVVRLPWRGTLRLAMLGLRRPGSGAELQVVALALGIATLLLLSLARSDFLTAWQMRLPPDAPNRFVLNLQPEQQAVWQAFFQARGMTPPLLQPMVRGRLKSINGRPVRLEEWPESRPRRLLEREFNLSWSATLPQGNEVVAGRWHGATQEAQFSVEQGLAETLGLRLGDRLEFEVAGMTLNAAPITSLRQLEWDSMRVNFFVIASPGLLEHQPVSFITSFYLPPEQTGLIDALVATMPNLTVIDVETIVRQLTERFDRVATAVQILFGFALLTGFVVLWAAIEASTGARQRELAVMRCLGARRRQLTQRSNAEFAVLGLLAGFLGALAALTVGAALMHFVFHLSAKPSLWPILAGPVLGSVGAVLASRFALRHLLDQPALDALRAAD